MSPPGEHVAFPIRRWAAQGLSYHVIKINFSDKRAIHIKIKGLDLLARFGTALAINLFAYLWVAGHSICEFQREFTGTFRWV